MNINELRSTVLAAAADSWRMLPIGPFFHDRLHVDGDYDATTFSHTHSHRAVLSSDIDISIEWGMDDGRERDEHHLWAETSGFPDPAVNTQGVDVFYRGSLVDRTQILAVDGNRSYVPTYRMVRVDDGDPVNVEVAKYAFHTSFWEFHLTGLINQLVGLDDFESYVTQSGIVVAPGSSDVTG